MWFASPGSGADLPALNASTLQLLRTARNDADAANALRAFVRRFGDGHLGTLDALSSQQAPAAEPERRSLVGLSAEQACAVVAEGASSDGAYSGPFESLAGFAALDSGAWTGKLYILTDGRVASSAEMFSAIVQDNKVARVIGTPTLGAGCGNMRKIQPLVLPHSQQRLQMPDCVRLRRDCRSEVSGITPDIRIEPVEGESPRTRGAHVAGDR